MFCLNCGQKLDDNAVFCLNCGAKINRQNLQSAPMQQGQPVTQAYEAQHYTQHMPVKPSKTKKRSGCLVSMLVIIGLISAIALCAAIFVPGLFKPHDLGIKTSNEAYESTINKLKLTKDNAPEKGAAEDYKYIYGNTQAVDIYLTSEEITSFLNINRPGYYALKNAQVRINPDNTIEAAATLDVSFVFKDILEGKYNKEDAKKALPMLGLLPNKVNLYCKFSGGIKDNMLDQLNIHKTSVMGIPIPESLINSSAATRFVEDNIGRYIKKAAAKSNAKYDQLKVDNEKLVFKGQIPSSISRISVR